MSISKIPVALNAHMCWDEDLFRPNKALNSTYDLNVKSAYFFNAMLSNLSNAIHDKLASFAALTPTIESSTTTTIAGSMHDSVKNSL